MVAENVLRESPPRERRVDERNGANRRYRKEPAQFLEQDERVGAPGMAVEGVLNKPPASAHQLRSGGGGRGSRMKTMEVDSQRATE